MISISRLWAYFKVLIPHNRVNAFRSIQPRERFRGMITRERARADRNQHVFSLLLFNTGDLDANSDIVQDLAHVLANRIRVTDDVGWFDSGHIGVLLPYASAVGAQTLADDIYKAITAKTPPPEYTIHTYPSKWFSNGNGHSAQFHFVDSSPELKTTASQGLSASGKNADGGNSMLGTQLPSTDTALSYEAFVQAIEPFFLHHLPIWKRAMDFVCALLGLVVLSPVLFLIALTIKVSSSRPIFFRQQRVGQSGRVFTMLKFQTMKLDIDRSAHKQHMSGLINGENSDRPMTKLDNHFQVTAFGRILRQASLDELPQLINVLLGSMSLVGPRPPLSYEVEEYLPWHYTRFDAVPGMTGLWQVSGKNRLAFLDMIRLDIQYLNKLSVRSDMMILLKTPLAIFSDIRESLALQKEQLLFKSRR